MIYGELLKKLTTDDQREKYIEVRTFFEKLIELEKSGCYFDVDEEIWTTPFVDEFEIGFKNGKGSKLLFVGSEWEEDESGDYTIPYISITVKELRERIVPLLKIEV